MKESIKMYRDMRKCKKRVLSQNPEYWTGASEQMYRHARSHMISQVVFWLVAVCAVSAIIYAFS